MPSRDPHHPRRGRARPVRGLSATLFLITLGGGCTRGSAPPPPGITVTEVCSLLHRQRADAGVMRGHAIAAYQTSVDDFELDRKFKAGTAGHESVTGKYSQAERRGWQNAFAGATWCRAAEMVHDEAIATAALLRDAELDQTIATRVLTDCSRDMFSTLLTGDPADEAKFIAAARQISDAKASLEQALVDRCEALIPK